MHEEVYSQVREGSCVDPLMSEVQLPDRIVKLWEEIEDRVSEEEMLTVKDLLWRFADVFHDGTEVLRHTTQVDRYIHTGDAVPIKQRPY